VTVFLNIVISGAVAGAIYSMMASALVLTYQTSGVFNFAQGAVAFVSAFFYFQLHTGQHLSIVVSAVITVLGFAPLFGLLLDRVLFRRLAEGPVFARIVGTIGLLVALPAIALWTVETVCNGVFNMNLPETTAIAAAGGSVPGVGPTPPTVWHLGAIDLPRVNINSDQLAVLAAAAVLAVLLWLLLRHTRTGLELRAAVDKKELSGLRGLNVARTSGLSWVLTMMISSLAGILIAPLFQLDPNTLTLVVLGSLVAVAVAGLRSIPIAMAGGLALGIIQGLIAFYGKDFLPSTLIQLSGFSSAIPFFLTVVVLFFVGRDRGRQAGSVAEERPRADHREGLPRWRRVLPWAVAVVALVVFSMQASAFTTGAILAPGIALSIVMLSFVVVTGIGGMVSLAQATFVTAGGFATGWVSSHRFGWNFPFLVSGNHLNALVACLVAAIVAGAIGALIAVPVRRLGALALALGTLSLALVADLAIFQLDSIRDGDSGYLFGTPSFTIFGKTIFNFSNPRAEVIVLMVAFGLIALLIRNLQSSSSGRAMFAIRSSPAAAGASGIIAGRSQISIFALSAGIAGFGGALMGFSYSSFTNTTAPALIGATWLAAAVTFGIRRPGGAFIAGLSVVATTQIFSTAAGWSWVPHNFGVLTTSTYFPSILFGLGAINLAMNPDGILALVGEQQAARRRRRADRALRSAPAVAPGEAVPIAEVATTPAPLVDLPVSDLPASEAVRNVSVSSIPDDAPLVLEDLFAGYGDVEVLHGVSLRVAAGSIVALVGANGAGKSTLCGVAAGLLAPTGGRILMGGVDLTQAPAYRRVRAGMLLAPEARGIFPALTVEENLEILLRSQAERDKAYERFGALGLRRRSLAGSLSGGEQQMLSLVPALIRPPQVFIADEPTLGLAPLARLEVVRALADLRALGVAIVLVEEKAAEVVELADLVGFMNLGRLGWLGPRSELTEGQLALAYLGGELHSDAS
jgi:branched-subunit amino acid ABC-type transport system permease component/ABC-type branched-subunit amino acid transport system ATPase component